MKQYFLHRGWTLGPLLFITTVCAQTEVSRPATLAGCPVFPVNNIWNTPVDTLPVDKNSDLYVDTTGQDDNAHPDFGASWDGMPMGIPYMVVDSSQANTEVTFDYADESDGGPYPSPDEPLIEGGPDGDGDKHILIVNKDTCTLYELFDARPQNGGTWTAGSGAIFDLTSNALRPEGWTSANAAGLPILPGLVRLDEVKAGEISHALRFTAPQTRQAYVWPARHYASDLTGENYPPLGQRFRLKADFDMSGFSPDVQVILTALKKYGMMLADNGSSWFISGKSNEGWDNDILGELKKLRGSDFEAVDGASLRAEENSGQVKQR